MDIFIKIFISLLSAILTPIVVSLVLTVAAKYRKTRNVDIPSRDHIDAIHQKKVIYSITKRLFSCLFALMALILFGPMYIEIHILNKLYYGSSITKMPCLGKDMKSIYLYKFQTSGIGDTIEHCKRRNSYGRLLRSTALDMLPRFINVLKGDIDLIGVYHYDLSMHLKYPKEIEHILEIGKPGLIYYANVLYLTGKQKEVSNLRKIIEADYAYLSQQSLLLDIRIMSIIVMSVFRRFNEPLNTIDTANELYQNENKIG